MFSSLYLRRVTTPGIPSARSIFKWQLDGEGIARGIVEATPSVIPDLYYSLPRVSPGKKKASDLNIKQASLLVWQTLVHDQLRLNLEILRLQISHWKKKAVSFSNCGKFASSAIDIHDFIIDRLFPYKLKETLILVWNLPSIAVIKSVILRNE